MLYFAYGSNMSEDQMRARCSRPRFAGLGSIPGQAFIINSRGCANIIPDERRTVHGVFWELEGADLQKLDLYEGTAFGCYERKRLRFAALDGSRHAAQVYVSPDRSTGVPGRAYLATILKGGRSRGLPANYLRRIAKTWSFQRIPSSARA